MTVRAVPAVSRAVAILRLLGRTRAPMGVKAIAEALGIVPSTALHILRVLVAEELVKVDSAKQYTLGMGTLALARASLESDDFPMRVQPHLDALSRRYGITAIGLDMHNQFRFDRFPTHPKLRDFVFDYYSHIKEPKLAEREPVSAGGVSK